MTDSEDKIAPCVIDVRRLTVIAVSNIRLSLLCIQLTKLSKRHITLNQTTAALRPFYFSVHPDLFGQHPTEKAVNEASLKVLSEYLEQIHNRRQADPKRVTFYVRRIEQESTDSGKSFRQVDIPLLSTSLLDTVKEILRTCDLSCDFINKLNEEQVEFPRPIVWDKSYYSFYGLHYKSDHDKKTSPPSIRTWMRNNMTKATELQELNKHFLNEAEQVSHRLCLQLGLLDVRWDCGWNYTHFLACLGAFHKLLEVSSWLPDKLKGKTLVFGPSSGVSIHGEVLLGNEEVPHHWLKTLIVCLTSTAWLEELYNFYWRLCNLLTSDQVLSFIEEQFEVLGRLPYLEGNLSGILRGIRVTRERHHPHLLAGDYESQLNKLQTGLSRADTSRLTHSLSHLYVIVESAGSALFLDSSGNFRVPHSHPGEHIIDYIQEHQHYASHLLRETYSNQMMEREAINLCIDYYRLNSLRRDTNVTILQMIKCCLDLTENNPYEIQVSLEGCRIVVSTYYTVMQSGDIYIPWNWVEGVR